MRGWVAAAIAAAIAAVTLTMWATATSTAGALPPGNWTPVDDATWRLTGPDAEVRRLDALRRARVRIGTADQDGPTRWAPSTIPAPLTCRYLDQPLSGTSSKFHCVLDGGEVVKVKYGRNPEIHAEAAATKLFAALEFPSDVVVIVPRIRCYGCPRLPFETLFVRSLLPLDATLAPRGEADGYTDFEWAAVEHTFPAPAIETDRSSGWAWWEMKLSQAPRADLDALRLLVVFLAHWDNKADNQRLVCLDGSPATSALLASAEPASTAQTCARPLALVHDLGATFGPYKVNLSQWRDAPIWGDSRRCVVSMRSLPYAGGTFADVEISEAGRLQFARRLAMLTDDDIRAVFEEARFGAFYSGTDDSRDLEAWTQAFRSRADRIMRAGPCA